MHPSSPPDEVQQLAIIYPALIILYFCGVVYTVAPPLSVILKHRGGLIQSSHERIGESFISAIILSLTQ